MQWVLDNIGVIIGALGVLLTLIGFLLSIFSNGKGGKVWQSLVKLIKNFPAIIGVAEKISDSGTDKKAYAMEQTILLCNSLKLEPTEEQLHELSELIDAIVNLSKVINQNSKSDTIITTTEVVEGTTELIQPTTTPSGIKPIEKIGGGPDEN